MKAHEHLLACLAEEAAEVIQDVSKSLRFGLDDVYLNQTEPKLTNKERLINELNDLFGVINVLEDEGILPRGWYNLDKQRKKEEKVRKFILYSKEVGALI